MSAVACWDVSYDTAVLQNTVSAQRSAWTGEEHQVPRLPVHVCSLGPLLRVIRCKDAISRNVYLPKELSGSERSLSEGTFCMEPRDRDPPAGTQESSGRSCLMAGMALSASSF
jgi:hypothetical protein